MKQKKHMNSRHSSSQSQLNVALFCVVPPMSGLFDCIWRFIKKPLKKGLGALSCVKTSDWDDVMDKKTMSTAGHSGHCPVS